MWQHMYFKHTQHNQVNAQQIQTTQPKQSWWINDASWVSAAIWNHSVWSQSQVKDTAAQGVLIYTQESRATVRLAYSCKVIPALSHFHSPPISPPPILQTQDFSQFSTSFVILSKSFLSFFPLLLSLSLQLKKISLSFPLVVKNTAVLLPPPLSFFLITLPFLQPIKGSFSVLSPAFNSVLLCTRFPPTLCLLHKVSSLCLLSLWCLA